MRLYNRLHRWLFPKTARAADLIRAAQLREANLIMQEAEKRDKRRRAVAIYFNAVNTEGMDFDDVPDWEIEQWH